MNIHVKNMQMPPSLKEVTPFDVFIIENIKNRSMTYLAKKWSKIPHTEYAEKARIHNEDLKEQFIEYCFLQKKLIFTVYLCSSARG